jgi:hypothetical protein
MRDDFVANGALSEAGYVVVGDAPDGLTFLPVAAVGNLDEEVPGE